MLGLVSRSCLLGPPVASLDVTPFGVPLCVRPSIFGLRVYGHRIALRLVRKNTLRTTQNAPKTCVEDTVLRRVMGRGCFWHMKNYCWSFPSRAPRDLGGLAAENR